VEPLSSPTSGLCRAQPLASVEPNLWPLSSPTSGLCPALHPASVQPCIRPLASVQPNLWPLSSPTSAFLPQPSACFLPHLGPAQIPAAHVSLRKYLRTPWPDFHAIPCRTLPHPFMPFLSCAPVLPNPFPTVLYPAPALTHTFMPCCAVPSPTLSCHVPAAPCYVVPFSVFIQVAEPALKWEHVRITIPSKVYLLMCSF
jgi:hypothetical protein